MLVTNTVTLSKAAGGFIQFQRNFTPKSFTIHFIN